MGLHQALVGVETVRMSIGSSNSAMSTTAAPSKVSKVIDLNVSPIGDFAAFEDTQSMAGNSDSFASFLVRSIREMTNIKFALASFVVNNLRRRYRRSMLGFAWSLLNPLMTMCVMTVVFSVLFKQDPKNFGVYVFTGLLPWSFFCESLVAGSGAIVDAEGYLKKVYIPKLFFPMVVVATEAANFGFSLAALLLLAAVCGFQFKLTCLLIVPIAALLFTFAYSCALFCSIATVYFRDFAHILRVGLGAVFYTVPIVYPVALIPEEYRWCYAFHPLARFVELFRLSLCEGKVPPLDIWAVPVVVTVAAFILAFSLLKKTERDIIFRL